MGRTLLLLTVLQFQLQHRLQLCTLNWFGEIAVETAFRRFLLFRSSDRASESDERHMKAELTNGGRSRKAVQHRHVKVEEEEGGQEGRRN